MGKFLLSRRIAGPPHQDMASIVSARGTHLAGFSLDQKTHARGSRGRRRSNSSSSVGEQQPTATTRDDDVFISSAKNARHRYLEIADTHVRAFYGSTIKRSEFWNTLLRPDRVMTLDDGRGRDNVDCLVGCVFDRIDAEVGAIDDAEVGAIDDKGDIAPQSSNWILSLLERALDSPASSSLPPSLPPPGEEGATRRRVVGAVTIDGNWVGGKAGRRDKHAYVANLAVHPDFRRRGIAERLMVEAEGRAREFGCKWAVLHVDERNAVGKQLYRKLGYRLVAKQGWWEGLVEGRREGERLVMLVKKV